MPRDILPSGFDEVVAPLEIILQSLVLFIIMLELRPPASRSLTCWRMVVIQHYDGPGIDTVRNAIHREARRLFNDVVWGRKRSV
jgi:hypothetical protein